MKLKMHLFILLAVVGLALAAPADSTENGELIEQDGNTENDEPNKSLVFPTDSGEYVDSAEIRDVPPPIEEEDVNVKSGKSMSIETPHDAPTVEPNKPSSNKSSSSGVCTEEGNVPKPDSCNFISCAPGLGGKFIEYEFPCPAATCFDPETGNCEWKTSEK